MFKIRTAVAGIVIATLSSFAGAAETKTPGSGLNPYTDCGIGAALFKDLHWAAVTSNVIWDLGSTALTSATASPEMCNAKNVETAQFIIDNYDNLAEETARGQGEHLTAMLNIRGCQATAHEGIISSIRINMAGHVASPAYSNLNDVEKASQYFGAMDSGVTQHADGCSA